MAKERSEQSYLREAEAIVHDLQGRVFFKHMPSRHAHGHAEFEYVIIRRGMGTIGTRKDAKGLVALLRKQLPENAPRREPELDE